MISLYKTLVWPVMPYGCETWKITKADKWILNSFQCQYLRWIINKDQIAVLTEWQTGEWLGGQRWKCLFYGIGLNTWRTKGERETKDHGEKECGEGEKQGRLEELEWNLYRGTEQRVLVTECVSLFPASRGLSRRDKLKREERDLCRLPTSCLMKPPTKFLVETYRFSKPVSFIVMSVLC